MSTSPLFDVAVLGAGPAGSALALRLAASGHSVALLEAGCFDRERIGESLPPGVQPLLRELRVWEEFMALDPLPSWGTWSAWGGPLQAHSHLEDPYLNGWHVDRAAMDAMLAQQAAARGADLRTGTRVMHAAFDNLVWRLSASSGETFRSRVVVDATGRRALLARQLDARRLSFDHLVGVGTVCRRLNPDEGHVLVEAVPEGWWYSAPLPSGGLIVMLMTDADVCRSEHLARPQPWRQRLLGSLDTAARVDHEAEVVSLRVYPAGSVRHLTRDSRPWLAVGDAGLAVDPLAGDGVVRALRSAAAAADVVMDLLHADPEDGAAARERYEELRNVEFSQHLRTRLAYYAAVDGSDSVFWARRRSAANRSAGVSG